VPGLSDNISVRSLVGRWLEHSRVYYFGAGHGGDELSPAERSDGRPPLPASIPAGGAYYIGSADMMERNLDRRVEAVVPVPSALHPRLREILEVELADDRLAWGLHGDGTWTKIPTVVGISAHDWLQEAARMRDRTRRDDTQRVVP
jgi:polyphosphate kinase